MRPVFQPAQWIRILRSKPTVAVAHRYQVARMAYFRGVDVAPRTRWPTGFIKTRNLKESETQPQSESAALPRCAQFVISVIGAVTVRIARTNRHLGQRLLCWAVEDGPSLGSLSKIVYRVEIF